MPRIAQSLRPGSTSVTMALTYSAFFHTKRPGRSRQELPGRIDGSRVSIARNRRSPPGPQPERRESPPRANQRHRINLIQQNADMMPLFIRAYGEEVLHGAYNIGFWFWELPSARSDWHSYYEYVDEIWVASEFCRRSFSCLTRLPVTRMPWSSKVWSSKPFIIARISVCPIPRSSSDTRSTSTVIWSEKTRSRSSKRSAGNSAIPPMFCSC